MSRPFIVTVFSCLIVILAGGGKLFADTLISPADSRINYYGRFDLSTPAMPAYAWPGSAIEANLPGPIIGFKLVDGQGDYEIEIDGKLDSILVTDTQRDIIIGSNFSDELHRVRITLRSEHHYFAASFRGFYLADGKVPGPPPAKPSRKIEFIGDSYTAGYGIESSVTACSDSLRRSTTNVNKSFATLVTRAFHAQSTVLAWSGAGICRNYGEPTKRGQTPYPSRYNRTLSSASGKKWDFSSWIPHLVVICLGTNDFSTEPVPDDSMFIGDYHKLIEQITLNYPDAAIACVATHDPILRQKVASIVDEEQSARNHQQVFGAQFPDAMELSACDFHPSVTDNRNIAALLIDTIMKKMAWDTTATAIASCQPLRSGRPRRNGLSVMSLQGKIVVTPVLLPAQLQEIRLCNPQGICIARTVIGVTGNGSFSTHTLSSGMYLVGSKKTGWRRVAVHRYQ